MIIWYGIGLDGLALLILLCTVTFGYHWSRHDGYEAGYNEGRADRAHEELQARREERARTGRHARAQPPRRPERTALMQDDPRPAPEPAEAAPERITWDRDDAVGGPAELPGKWYAERIAASMAVRRAMVDVVLPEPGTYLPQPGRDSGPGTVTFPRLELPATTGELAAVTDQYIADMAVQEETFRLGLAT